MKNKVVIWGTNAQNEKVLMALELNEAENKVLVYVVPEPLASEEFITKLNDEWKENKGTVEFPEGHSVVTRDLSVTEGILPEDLKADRPDMVSRAQTEWHFIVLSGKLHRAYQQELEELREKVASISEFDNGLWQTLRAFWDKVQEQSRERNLFRSHANTLRDAVNQLFNDMKAVRTKVEDQFSATSAVVMTEINEKLAEIEARIEKGGNKMHLVFEDLKALQGKYRTAKMSNEHRSKVYDRIDAAFKAAKEKRFGSEANEGSIVERHTRRLQGLLEAMNRMKESARRDESELEFQRKKVATTEGQLEAQIRQAKIKMVEERLASKKERIADMEKTKADIDRQIKSVSDREDKKQRLDQAKETAKSEIAAITTKKPGVSGSGERVDNVPATQSVMDALSNIFGETFEDVVDTVKAVASVVGEKAEAAMDKALDIADEVVEIVNKDRSAATPDAEPVADAPVETPVAEAVEVETPVAEAAAVETPVVEAAAVETPVAEAAEVETPVAEAAEVETPVTEAAEVETPVAEAAEVETPVVEAAEVETPVVEAASAEPATAAAAPEVSPKEDEKEA